MMENKSIILQLQKDLSIPEGKADSLEDLTENWGQYFNELIKTDFQKMVGLLYRIDVSETRLREMLRENPGKDAGKIIASLTIERLLQKIRTRNEYRSGRETEKGHPDEEEW